MKVKFYINIITKRLERHKKFVDEIAEEFTKELNAKKLEIEQMQGKYTVEYIQQTLETEIANIKNKYQFQLTSKQKSECAQIEKLCASLNKEVNNYFAKPIDVNLLNLINLINVSDMGLSPAEMELLNNSAKSYFEKKAIANLFSKNKNDIEQGETYYTGNGYYTHDIKIPDIEKAYVVLKQFSQEAMGFMENYTGQKMELSDKPFNSKETFVAKTKCHFLENNTGEELINLLGESVGIVSGNSEEDKKIIDALIDVNYPTLAKDRAVEIAKASPEIAVKLVEDERYSEVVLKAMEEM